MIRSLCGSVQMVMKRASAIIGTALALGVSACGSTASSRSSATHVSSAASAGAAPAGAKIVHIAIKGFAFRPATITVAPGTKLDFSNSDATAHTATSTSPGFDTGTVAPKASKTVTVTKAGTYSYYCQFHAFMKATIVVR